MTSSSLLAAVMVTRTRNTYTSDHHHQLAEKNQKSEVSELFGVIQQTTVG